MQRHLKKHPPEKHIQANFRPLKASTTVTLYYNAIKHEITAGKTF